MPALVETLRLLESTLPPEVIQDPDFLGLRITEDGKEAIISVSSSKQIKHFEDLLKKSPSFVNALNTRSMLLRVIEGALYKPQAAMAGSAGFGQGLNGFGTLGWFLFLDNQLVVVSNHHVFCAAGDNTPLNTRVFMGRPGQSSVLGRLIGFDPLGTTSPRLFDFAVAAIDDPSLILAEFVDCASGGKYLYPTRFGTFENVRSGDSYYTVGARTPSCAEGNFRGVGSARVGPYTNGQSYLFQEQLFFDPISQPGDSGSLVIQKSSNLIVGLIFAGLENKHSVANPFFRKGWTYTGTRVMQNIELPTYQSVSPTLSEVANTNVAPPDLSTPRLPPIFNPGRTLKPPTLLNSYTKVVQPLGEWVQVEWEVPPHEAPDGTQVMGGLYRGWVHTLTGLMYPE